MYASSALAELNTHVHNTSCSQCQGSVGALGGTGDTARLLGKYAVGLHKNIEIKHGQKCFFKETFCLIHFFTT